MRYVRYSPCMNVALVLGYQKIVAISWHNEGMAPIHPIGEDGWPIYHYAGQL